MYPNIKFKDCDQSLAQKLKKDLLPLSRGLLSYADPDFDKKKLDRIRIRIFKFQKKETCNEFFAVIGRKRYVCLNVSLLKRRYYTGLQHALHGIAHHFSHFRNEVGNEIFCEFVSYSVLEEMLGKRGEKLKRRIFKSIMKASPKEYNMYYRVGRRLNQREAGILLKLNSKAKNKKISKKKEGRIFSRLLKSRIKKYDDIIKELPELEKGFKRV